MEKASKEESKPENLPSERAQGEKTPEEIVIEQPIAKVEVYLNKEKLLELDVILAFRSFPHFSFDLMILVPNGESCQRLEGVC